ncbi:MAG: YihY/virulence factor BrkB family protein [Lapillicoccus sp.]
MKQLWSRFSKTRAWQSWTRFGQARGNLLAAGVAFYGFFSIFPAVAIAAVVFGFVLRGRPDLLATVGDTLNTTLPGVIKTAAHPDGLVALAAPDISLLTISGVVAVVSLLVSGTGWVGALRDGIRTIFGVEGAPGNVVTVKLRDLGVLATLGVAVLVSAGLTALTGALSGVFADVLGDVGSRVVVTILGVLVGFLVDAAIMVVLLRVLSGVGLPWADIRQGAVVGALGQGIVKFFGVQLIANATKNPLFGSLVLVIGLLFWLNLIAKLILLGAAWAANDVDASLARLEAESGESVSDDEVAEHQQRVAALGRTPVGVGRSQGAVRGVSVAAAGPVGVEGLRHSRGGPVGRASTRAAGADLQSERGRAVGGVPAFGQRTADRTTIAAGVVLGATVAVAAGSAGRAVKALFTRR